MQKIYRLNYSFYKTGVILLVAILLVIFSEANSQECLSSGACSNFVNQYPNTTLTPGSSWATKNSMNAGNWTVFNVICGNTYEWTYCEAYGGVSTSWDAALTLYFSTGSTPQCFSDNYCGTGNKAPYLRWHSSVTGTVRILTSKSGCSSNSGSPYNTLAYREVVKCTGWTLNPTYNSMTSASGFSGSTTVTTSASRACYFNFVSSDSWINNLSGNNGSGSAPQYYNTQTGKPCTNTGSSGAYAQINYKADANTTGSPRTGYIYLYDLCNNSIGAKYTVYQDAMSCNYSLSSYSHSFSNANSNSNSFNVTTQSSCNWSANVKNGSGWLSSSSNGTGNGTINYSVTQNTGNSSRTGTIDVGGETFTVSQPGVSCNYSLSSYSYTFSNSIANSNSFDVIIQSACNWSANVTSGSGWLSSNSNGTGNGTINYSVTQNTGSSSRTGTIEVGGKTFTVTQPTTSSLPTVTVTSPNGGENWVVGTSNKITATITGSITGIEIHYSIDDGDNWKVITGMSTTQTTLNHKWTVPNNISTKCKIRVRVLYSGGIISDFSNSNFTISSPSGGQSFILSQDLSHLRWPFPNSSWTNRSGWRGAEGGSNRPLDGYQGGNGHGEGGHHKGEYFADDWNNTKLGSCDQIFNSPVAGKVIYVNSYCKEDCGSKPTCLPRTYNCGLSTNTNPSGLGNQVIIKCYSNEKYAFRVCHLNELNVTLGQTVNIGDKLGTIGNTGGSKGAHAHCVLYKNIHLPFSYFSGVSTGLESLTCGYSLLIQSDNQIYDPNEFAVDFIFDAVSGGELGSGGGTDDFLSISINGSTLLCSGDSTILFAPKGNSYYWSTGDTSRSITVKKGGQYFVSYFDSNSVSVTIGPVNITVATPNIAFITSNGKVLCQGEKLILSASEGKGYVWSNGNTTPDIAVSSAGIYSVIINDYSGCYFDTVQIDLPTNPSVSQPTIQINGIYLAANLFNNVTYQWNLFGKPIDGANSQFYTVTTTGYYSVSVTNNSGCSSTSIPVFITTAGIEDFTNTQSIKVYPNPANNKLTVDFDLANSHKSFSIELYNTMGQLVLSTSINNLKSGNVKQDINVHSLVNGVYILQLRIDDGTNLNLKVIIQK